MTRAPWDITPEMFLSTDEVCGLLAHVRTAYLDASAAGPVGDDSGPAVDRVIIEGLLFSGLRCSEFCALRLCDFAQTDGAATLRVRGRGENERLVWLPSDTGALLDHYVHHLRPRLLAPGLDVASTQQPLIVNERGRAYERTGLYRRVVRILTAADLGARASVQLLRHTYGYLAYLRTGGNLLFVQRQLGHAHPMVTAVYAALVPESYGELANAVGALAGGTETAPSSRAATASPDARRLNRPRKTGGRRTRSNS